MLLLAVHFPLLCKDQEKDCLRGLDSTGKLAFFKGGGAEFRSVCLPNSGVWWLRVLDKKWLLGLSGASIVLPIFWKSSRENLRWFHCLSRDRVFWVASVALLTWWVLL